MGSIIWFSLVFVAVGIQLILAANPQELPDKFLGSWKVAESKGFDEYLVAKGYGWLTRQLILYSPVTKVFEKSANIKGDYNAFIITPTKDAKWFSWRLGTPFIGLYVDDKQHKITFDYIPPTDTFTETHQDLTKDDDSTDLIKYQIKNGRLEMTIEFNKVIAVRYYDKQN